MKLGTQLLAKEDVMVVAVMCQAVVVDEAAVDVVDKEVLYALLNVAMVMEVGVMASLTCQLSP